MRLLLAVITTLIWEAMLAAVWLWGLPALGIHLPLFGLPLAMFLLAAWAIFSYRAGTRALGRRATIGMADMVSSKAKVVRPLSPEGMVNIQGELWRAQSIDGNIGKGEEVEVVRQEGLKLFVRKPGAPETSARVKR